MWFKQNEQKSPQQPEIPAPRPQQSTAVPVAPAQPAETAPTAPAVAAPSASPAANASRITPGLTLKGEVSGKEDLWIGGNIDGKLHFDSARVSVGASGKVQGEIEAREVVIEGKVEGNLRATERLEIATTGNVRGDATAPRVALQEGAVFNGAMEILRPGESRSVTQGAPASSRTAGASRGSRLQSAQAAGAAVSAVVATSPSATASAAAEAPENPAAVPTVFRHGIASESSERSD